MTAPDSTAPTPPDLTIVVTIDMTRAGAQALLVEIDRIVCLASSDAKGVHGSKIPALLALAERIRTELSRPAPYPDSTQETPDV